MKFQRFYQKYEYARLGGCYIKSTLYERFLNWNKIFKKTEVITGKTLFLVIGPFGLTILFVLILASDRVGLFGNVVFNHSTFN